MPRWRRPGEGTDPLGPNFFMVDVLEAFPTLLAIVIAVTVTILVLFPLAILLVEVLLLIFVVLFGLLARVLLRRPWIVEAANVDGTETQRWAVVGWRRSGHVVEEVARALSAGGRYLSPHARELPSADP